MEFRETEAIELKAILNLVDTLSFSILETMKISL